MTDTSTLRFKFEMAIEEASRKINNANDWWDDHYGTPVINELLDDLVKIYIEEKTKEDDYSISRGGK